MSDSLFIKFKNYLNYELRNEKKYFELIDDLGASNSNQIEFVNYVLSANLRVEKEYMISIISRELYGFEEEDYNVNLKTLYGWVLNVMFKKEFYEYSTYYKFCDLLVKISKDDRKVYQNIIDKIDVHNPITAQIAICSIYGHYDFYKYEELTKKFLNKILISIENNKINQGIITDFNRFIKNVLELPEYNKYQDKFKSCCY